MQQGQIVRLVNDKRFGFVRADDGDTDFFFHQSALAGVRFDSLQVGDRVNFDADQSSVKGPRVGRIEVLR